MLNFESKTDCTFIYHFDGIWEDSAVKFSIAFNTWWNKNHLLVWKLLKTPRSQRPVRICVIDFIVFFYSNIYILSIIIWIVRLKSFLIFINRHMFKAETWRFYLDWCRVGGQIRQFRWDAWVNLDASFKLGCMTYLSTPHLVINLLRNNNSAFYPPEYRYQYYYNE